MSLSFGLYDIFAHLAPGVLFLYILNEFLTLMNWPTIDINKLTNPIYAILMIVIAYISGILLYAVFDRLWYHRVYQDVRKQALVKIQKRFSIDEIKFNVDEAGLITEILRVRNRESFNDIDRHKVNSIMMRNITFCLIFYIILQISSALINNAWFPYIPTIVITLGLISFTYKLAQLFDQWHYRGVFGQALSYGSNLREFLNNDKPCWKGVTVNKQNKGDK